MEQNQHNQANRDRTTSLQSQLIEESEFPQQSQVLLSPPIANKVEKGQGSSQTVKKKKVGNYILFLDQLLGKGSFSKVYYGERITPLDHQAVTMMSLSSQKEVFENKYAIKEIPNEVLLKKLGPKGQEALNKEIEISAILKHKNIVRLFDTVKTANNNYLVQEFCGGGDLKSFLTSKRRLSEPVAQRFMFQIASGLEYLYKQNIMHRDLKLQNILMTENSEQAVLKLADFGLAKRQETKEDLFDTICGTPIYMAPELQNHQQYNEKADLWSLGVILFEMVVGMPPFIASNKEELKRAIHRGTYVFPKDIKISPFCQNLIEYLLRQDVSSRIEWKDFFEHPFIKCDEKTFRLYYEGQLMKTAQLEEEQKINIPAEKGKPVVEAPQKIVQEILNPKEESVQLKPKSDQIQEQQLSKPEQLQKRQSIDEIPALQPQPSKTNSESLTQEDLEETIEEIFQVIDILIERAQNLNKVIENEVNQTAIFPLYNEFEDDLKYLTYRMVVELKQLYFIFCGKVFKRGLPQDLQKLPQYEALSESIAQLLRSQYPYRYERTYSLRIYTTSPKEIKLTKFLLEKLAEKQAGLIPKLVATLPLYQALSHFISDYIVLVDQLDLGNLPANLISYGLSLLKEGVVLDSLEETESARALGKYESALFLMQELNRELYHSLKFSGEENGILPGGAAGDGNVAELGAAEERIKSFTFDVAHAKLEFTSADEELIGEVIETIRTSLAARVK